MPGTSEGESLALWGLPLSDLQTETLSDGKAYQVQWFGRGRFELHPEHAPPADVLLGLLGSEVRAVTAPASPPSVAPPAPPPPPDPDCGDIPHKRFRVIGSDPHRFDGDNDGIGCER